MKLYYWLYNVRICPSLIFTVQEMLQFKYNNCIIYLPIFGTLYLILKVNPAVMNIFYLIFVWLMINNRDVICLNTVAISLFSVQLFKVLLTYDLFINFKQTEFSISCCKTILVFLYIIGWTLYCSRLGPWRPFCFLLVTQYMFNVLLSLTYDLWSCMDTVLLWFICFLFMD